MPDTPTPTPSVTNKRPIQFGAKMQGQHKEKILAVAWMTATRDGYEGANVSGAIAHDLAEAGYRMTSEEVNRETKWLEDNGYAVRSQYGRRVRIFLLEPDVIVPEPGFVRARKARDAGRPSANGASRTHRRPPVPRQRVDTPPWMPALVEGLTDWWREEPADADMWAAEVASAVGIVL